MTACSPIARYSSLGSLKPYLAKL